MFKVTLGHVIELYTCCWSDISSYEVPLWTGVASVQAHWCTLNKMFYIWLALTNTVASQQTYVEDLTDALLVSQVASVARDILCPQWNKNDIFFSCK